MAQDSKHAGNVVLIRGAALWLLVALFLAWCLVGMKFELAIIKAIFINFDRLLQAHIDFLLMSALIFGLYAAKVPLPWHVRWAIVIGAFTNSSLFLFQSIFPVLETDPTGLFPTIFRLYLMASIVTPTYRFGMGAIIVFKSSFNPSASDL